MSFGHWLKKRFHIKPLSNYYDDIGTALGFAGGALIGQPTLGAALGRSLGANIGPEHKGHKGVGLAVREGLKGAAIGELGNLAGAGKLVAREGGNLGIHTAATQRALAAKAIATPASATAAGGAGPYEWAADEAPTGAAAVAPTHVSALGQLQHAGKKATDYLFDPEKGAMRMQGVAAVGNAVGQYGQGQAEQAMARTQQQIAQKQMAQMDADLAAQTQDRQRDEERRKYLQPYYEALMKSLGGNIQQRLGS